MDKGNGKHTSTHGSVHSGTFRLNANRKALAVTLVAIMVAVTAAPLMVDNTGGTITDNSTTVVYHPYYSEPVLENGNYITGGSQNNWTISYVEYNSDNIDRSDSQEIKYYGTVWSTEYNPQLWTKGPGDMEKDWFPILKYSSGASKVNNTNVEAGRTLVFTGWKTAVYDSEGALTGVSDITYYPGEVIPKSVQDQATHEGKIHVYATWGYLNYTDIESVHRYNMDGTVNIGSLTGIDGNIVVDSKDTVSNIYTNIVGSINTYITVGNCTIDPSIKTNAETLAISTGSKTMKGNQIIQNATITGTFNQNHGAGNSGSLIANGCVLIMGLGITNGNDANVKNYPQIIGGMNGGTTSAGIQRTTFEGETDKLATMVIIHSGTYSNVIGGSITGTLNGSTYLSVRGATILDTMAGGCSGNGGIINGSSFVYATNMNMPGDTYEENNLGTRMGNFNGVSASHVSSNESTILTGASVNGRITENTHVYISGTTAVWDVQAAGRGGSSVVQGTANLDISGKSVVKHAACGSITDGISNDSSAGQHYTGDKQCVKIVNISIHDDSRVASVFGAGYDTFYHATYSSMYGDDSSINLKIDGGTVGYVYGGGYRGTVGTEKYPLDHVTIEISGGRIVGDVFLGGRGGLDKVCHNTNGSISWGVSHIDTTGFSIIYSKAVNLNITGGTIEGNVYGGGESVPVISKYDGISKPYNNTVLGESNSFSNGNGVASIVTESLNINIKNAVIKGDFFGAGKGVDISDLDGNGRHRSAYIKTMDDKGTIIDIPWIGNGTSKGTEIVDNSDYMDYASVIVNGNLSISIENSRIGNGTEGNAYGGGALGKLTVNGRHIFMIKNTDVSNSVYGGGKGSVLDMDLASAVVGSSEMTLISESDNTIGNSVYGGGELSSYNSGDTVTISIKGYKIGESVYGGGKGIADSNRLDWALLKAEKIALNIDDSRISFSVYGGGAYGKVSAALISVSVGNAVIGDSVYGGGKGHETNIEIARIDASDTSVSVSVDGSTINGSVYGGGELSQAFVKEVSVSITNGSNVKGSAFGGGKGIADNTKTDFALLKADTIVLNLSESTIDGSVYGGGRQSRVEGNITVNIDNNALVKGSVFGGGLGSTGDVSTKGSRNVRISRSAINGSVFGSSSLGNDNTDLTNRSGQESKVEIDNSSIGSSIYGGGFKGTLYGDTSIVIGDNTSVKFSVYGGADIGDVTGSSFDSILVHGCSEITVSGSGITIGRSIFGSGNSCKVDDGDPNTLNTIVINGLGSNSAITMESIQSADRTDITASKLILTGRSDASMSQASTKYSLNHIKLLNVHDNTTLNLRASIDDIGEYGSYIDATTPSTLENPSNTIVLNDGIIFSVSSDKTYGLVHGFTALSKNSTYGAYAYGSIDTDENSGFCRHEGGLYVKLEPSIFTEQNCKCWFLKGALTHDVTIVAPYGQTESTVSSVIPVSYTSNGAGDESQIVFTGSTPVILRNGSMNLVKGSYENGVFSGSSALTDASMFGLIVGASKGEYTMTFGNGNGINALESAPGNYEGFVGKRDGIPVVSFTLFFNQYQEYTGYVGYVTLHFIEVTKANDEYTVINEIDIRLAIHTEGDTDSFETGKEYSLDISLDQGYGSGTFSIPRSFKDYTLLFDNSTVRDGKAYNTMYIQTVSNEGNTFGWNNPMNSPIPMYTIANGSAMDSLKGTHAATLSFSFENCASQQTTVVKLDFILRPDTAGSEIRFSLTIHITPIVAHSVTFHSKEFDKPIVISVNDGKTIASTLIPSTGKYFVGWFRDENHSIRYDFTTPITIDMDLYADYRFTATFIHGNGIEATYYVDANTVDGSRIYKPDDPVRNGYDFAGWTVGDKIYFTDKMDAGAYYEIIYDDIEYTAIWKGNTVEVEFEIGSGIDEDALIGMGFQKKLTFNFGETYAQGHKDSSGSFSIDDNTKILKKYLDTAGNLKFVRWELCDSNGTPSGRYIYSDMQIQSTSNHVLKAQLSTTAILMDLNENKPQDLGEQYPEPNINAPMKSLLFSDANSYVLKPSSGYLRGFVLSGWNYQYSDGTFGFIPNGGSITFRLEGKIVTDGTKGVNYTEVADDTEYNGAYRIELKAVWKQIDYTLTVTPPLGNASITVLEIGDFNNNLVSDNDLTKLHYGYTVKLKYDRNGAGYTFSNWEYSNCTAVENGDEITITISENCSVSARQGGMYSLDIEMYMDGLIAKDYSVQIISKNDNSKYYSLKYSDGKYTNTMIPVGTYDLQISHNNKWYSVDTLSVYSPTAKTIHLYSIEITTDSGLEQYVSCIPFATEGTETSISVSEGYEVIEVISSDVQFISEHDLIFKTIDSKMTIVLKLHRITHNIELRNNIDGITSTVTVDYDGVYSGIRKYIGTLNIDDKHEVYKIVAFYGTSNEKRVDDGMALVTKADHEVMIVITEKEQATYRIILKYQTLVDDEYDENIIEERDVAGKTISIDPSKYSKNGFVCRNSDILTGTNDGSLEFEIIYDRQTKEFIITKTYDYYLDGNELLIDHRVEYGRITLKFEESYTPSLTTGVDIIDGVQLYTVGSQTVSWEMIKNSPYIDYMMRSVEFDVIFDLNGGTGGGPYPSTYIYAKGLAFDGIDNPTLDEYDFVGWTLDDVVMDKYAIVPGSFGEKILSAKWTPSVVNVTVNHHTEGVVKLMVGGRLILGVDLNGVTTFSNIRTGSDVTMIFESDENWSVLKWYVDGIDHEVVDNSITIKNIREDTDTTVILKSIGSAVEKKDYGTYTIVLKSLDGKYDSNGKYIYRIGSAFNVNKIESNLGNISFEFTNNEGVRDIILVSDLGPLTGMITTTLDCDDGLGFATIHVIFIGTAVSSGETTTEY